MADAARVWTDEQLLEIEAHIRQIYTQAQDEISVKWRDYMRRTEPKLESLYNAYLSAPLDKKQETLQKYQNALQNYTFKNKWYKNMVDETTLRLANVNEIAIKYINGQIPAIYATNFNFIDSDAIATGINWTLRDEYTVRNMIMDTLPEKELNYAKDMTWNRKQINSSVLQGILQGESIDKISKRLYPIVGRNQVAAVRTARTTVTMAENRGRQDRYEDYESQGVVMKKVWIATPDRRVRDWHISMDGQEVGVDESFVDGLGQAVEFPGDPLAPPNTIYNCRCTMRSHIIGIKQSDGSVKKITYSGDKPTMHASQIAAEKRRRDMDED